MPYDVCALSERFFMPRTTVHRHIYKLEEVGFVRRERQGRSRLLLPDDNQAVSRALTILLDKYVWPNLTGQLGERPYY